MFLRTEVKTYNLSERTHIMGILNTTPDSFSDGGSYVTIESAIKRALDMEAAGADIIDVGGESTRPNHAPVTDDEEIDRVIPVIEALSERLSIPISIDTYKSTTAKAAIEAGASIINDVWGAKKDPLIAKVAAEKKVPIILMHNRDNNVYNNLIEDMIEDLEESIAIVSDAGVIESNIILDPGIGFAKTVEDNYKVLKDLELFKQLGYPMLLGASRKSFINKVIDVEAKDRDNATGATTCHGVSKGVSIVRVHDVKRNRELAKMMDAMLRGGKYIG